jgi:protein involved in polysaccharide export with SLBB domain
MAAATALLVWGQVLTGQVVDLDPSRIDAPREQLVDLLDRLDQAASSPAYSEVLRAQVRQEAAVLRARLERGDFRVGDRILLRVENQPALSDTFVVASGLVLELPQIGDVSLRGVMRSELEPFLAEELGRFLREPHVRAHPTVRIAISGGIGRPGFHTVPSDIPIPDVIMLAGGPAQNANMEKIRIERGDRTIWEPDQLRQALIDGRTLGQLNVLAGDHIVIPQRATTTSAERTLRLVTVLMSTTITIVAFANIFN